MGQHAVAPLTSEEMKDLFLRPTYIEVPTTDRDEATIPEDLMGVMALSRNRESAAVVFGEDALRLIDELLLGRTLARTLRRGCQDSGPRHSKEAETRSSELSDRHHTLTPHEVSGTHFEVERYRVACLAHRSPYTG